MLYYKIKSLSGCRYNLVVILYLTLLKDAEFEFLTLSSKNKNKNKKYKDKEFESLYHKYRNTKKFCDSIP